MKCNCQKAKEAYLILNRAGYAKDVAVLCLRCEKIWKVRKM
jgi:primosomal protein N'